MISPPRNIQTPSLGFRRWLIWAVWEGDSFISGLLFCFRGGFSQAKQAAFLDPSDQCHQHQDQANQRNNQAGNYLSLIHISEPTRLGMISYAVFCLKKKKNFNI